MRHYEIVFLVHPDQSEQVPGHGGALSWHDRKRRGHCAPLRGLGPKATWPFQINDVHKAHYVLLNIECEHTTLEELENVFRFNDAVIRSMVLRRDKAVTETSPMMKEVEQEREREQERAAASDHTPSAQDPRTSF